MASSFSTALRKLQPKKRVSRSQRSWIFVPPDQLSDAIGPLSRAAPTELGIVLVESPWKAELRPYHKQKLALVLTNLRHFALEQAKRGVAVRHVVSPGPYREALAPLCEELGPLAMMEPAERELRVDLEPLVTSGDLIIEPHGGWLSTPEDFAFLGDPPWRMDAFYRRIRRRTGLLMNASGKPEGGKFSFDPENRKPWPGHPEPPVPLRFEPDEITREVVDLVERRFSHHPGRLDPAALPASAGDAERLWQWALESCLPHFGPYEDAMTAVSTGLFHSRVSPLLHLHRLLPARVVTEVEALDLPLATREGFIRQVLGWREFIAHVHRTTDGFRTLAPSRRTKPGDGGYRTWSGKAWKASTPSGIADSGARPNALEAHTPIPRAYWGVPSGLHCLDHVVQSVWDAGWSHHITRLMVLSNLASLLDVDPRALTDWFWVAYTDAYDWVVEPNVLAMGTFSTGELMTTKPYVSGAAYINRMSDYCKDCAFHPKKNCPYTRLYWAYLERHRDRLSGNPRLRLPLKSASRRSREDVDLDRAVFEWVTRELGRGRRLDPEDAPRT